MAVEVGGAYVRIRPYVSDEDARALEALRSLWGGHAFPIVAYDETGFVVVTWGGLLKMTTAFFSAYVDEVYAVASSDFAAGPSGSPQGFDLAQLEADVAGLTA